MTLRKPKPARELFAVMVIEVIRWVEKNVLGAARHVAQRKVNKNLPELNFLLGVC